MAFSYSDKNFTVVGNLCFVHIILDGTQTIFDIPPAISDRMLPNAIVSIYPYSNENKVRGASASTIDIGIASIFSGKIFCSVKAASYLSFYFPIDSNK